MRRGLIALLFVLGVGTLLYPLWGPVTFKTTEPDTSPKEEMRMKLETLQNDAAMTERLCRLDCGNHMRMMLTELDKASPEKIKTYVDGLQKDHKHLSYILWMDRKTGQEKEFGALPAKWTDKSRQTIHEHVVAAKQNVAGRKPYESPSITVEGKRYLVLGMPSDGDGERGVVAVISQNVVQHVTNHQRRNLRLVPFPSESRYRTESVDADTMRDTTVKDGEDNGNASHYYKRELVVRFQQDPTAEQMEQIRSDIDCEHERKVGNTYIFKSRSMSVKQLEQYFQRWNPLYVEPHYLYLTNEAPPAQAPAVPAPANPAPADPLPADPQAAEIPNDTLYQQYQWNLPMIETNKGWSISKGSNDVIVAVVDTGVDLTHSDLKGQLLDGYNVIDPSKPPQDDVGHGTHVAGIIAALVNNNEGVAGMTWYNKILPVKVLDSSGAGTSYSVAEGIIWATDHGAKVINLSLGNYAEAQFLHDAIKYAFDRDVVLIAATGNDNTDRPGYPAAYPEVFAVSATDYNRKKASFSNYGNYIDVVAPGATIASTYLDNQYAALSGTSMASPHVAALAALIRSKNPALTNTEVMDIMRRTSIDLGNPGRDEIFGYGQVDVIKALREADQGRQSLNFFPQLMRRRLEETMRKFGQ